MPPPNSSGGSGEPNVPDNKMTMLRAQIVRTLLLLLV